MDTSETYIKMCEKAGEIQGNWKPAIDDLVIFRDYGRFDKRQYARPLTFIDNSGECYVLFDEYRGRKKDCFYWLPHQDQLQEMVGEKDTEELINTFLWSCGYIGWDEFWHPEDKNVTSSSLEQLWLTSVMKKKYGKTWNGQEWVTNGY